MGIEIAGVTHVALELSSPTRMERYLHDTFGLQLLRVGYYKGEYVRIMGSPHHQQENPGFLWLFNRPFIPRGRLRHLAFGIRGRDVASAVTELRTRGHDDIDDEDILTAPGGLRIKIDSFDQPRAIPADDPVTKLVEVEVDPDLPCLVRNIHHVALEVRSPRVLLSWLRATFGLDGSSFHDRRGEFIGIPYYTDGPRDAMGRRIGTLALFLRRGLEQTALNHIAFDMADSDEAIEVIESRGAKVDFPGDAMIHGPEEVWYQIDSNETPFPVDHPANQTGVTLMPYGKHLRKGR